MRSVWGRGQWGFETMLLAVLHSSPVKGVALRAGGTRNCTVGFGSDSQSSCKLDTHESEELSEQQQCERTAMFVGCMGLSV